MPPAKIEVVGLLIFGVPDDLRLGYACARPRPETGRDRLRDFLLHVEDCTQTSVVALRPQLKSVRDIREPHRDPQLIARAAHAAIEHRRHLKLVADRFQIITLATE